MVLLLVDSRERLTSPAPWWGRRVGAGSAGRPRSRFVVPAGRCLSAQDDRGEFGDVPPGLAHRVGGRPVLDGPGQRPDSDDRGAGYRVVPGAALVLAVGSDAERRPDDALPVDGRELDRGPAKIHWYSSASQAWM